MASWRGAASRALASANVGGNARVRLLAVASCCSRSYSTTEAVRVTESPAPSLEEAIGSKPILVRDFIKFALYDPTFGYFSRKPDVVGVLPEPLVFSNFSGRRAFTKYLAELYKQNDASWFTPVELFQPWYGYAIAEYILQTMNPRHPLKIYEVGGGTGTCASNILEYIKLKDPEIYATMKYTSVEASEGLAKKQHQRLCEKEKHGGTFRVECRSASDKAGWGSRNEDPCYVIMLEVLDNTPHDLLYKESVSSPWMEAYVQYDRNESKFVERFRPIQDPLIIRCFDIVEKESEDFVFLHKMASSVKAALSKLVPSPRKLWIPTGCLELLDALHSALPEMVLVASDFSSLPDVKVPGDGAPIVSSKSGGLTKDYSSYLDAVGEADIFFPTDFRKLQMIDNESALTASEGRIPPNKQGIYRGSAIMKSDAFLSRFGHVSKGKTKDGYNALLEQYSNTRVYLSAPALR